MSRVDAARGRDGGRQKGAHFVRSARQTWPLLRQVFDEGGCAAIVNPCLSSCRLASLLVPAVPPPRPAAPVASPFPAARCRATARTTVTRRSWPRQHLSRGSSWLTGGARYARAAELPCSAAAQRPPPAFQTFTTRCEVARRHKASLNAAAGRAGLPADAAWPARARPGRLARRPLRSTRLTIACGGLPLSGGTAFVNCGAAAACGRAERTK